MKGSGTNGFQGHHPSITGYHGDEGSHRHGSQGGHSQGLHQWDHLHGNKVMHHGHHSHSNFNSSESERSDPYLDYEEFLEEDDEIYLKPGEPYGACLEPVENPYVRSDKVAEANRELFNGPQKVRKNNAKVRIWEERNEYYELDDNYEGVPMDDYEGSETFNVGRHAMDRSSHTPIPSFDDTGQRRSPPPSLDSQR